MLDDTNLQKTVERLETEIIGLKIRISRLESFVRDFPNIYDYIDPEDSITSSEDELTDKVIEIVQQYDKASSSLLQRRLLIGYARACRIMDILENRGIVSPADGANPRNVLIKK